MSLQEQPNTAVMDYTLPSPLYYAYAAISLTLAFAVYVKVVMVPLLDKFA